MDWDNLKSIFLNAAELDSVERPAYLDKACAGDPAARREVELLLRQNASEALDFLLPSDTRQTLEPGAILASRFKIVRLLGQGGMGEVYLAEDTELSEQVALKIVRSDVARDPQFLSRFRREVQFARQITHPNICRVFDLGRDQGPDGERVFFTMEYLDGESLDSHIKRHDRLEPAVALDIARQLAAGLTALHDKGIVHRDLKPANIIILRNKANSGRVVIGDFGLARAVDASPTLTQLTRTGIIVGTPEYIAPEQLAGAPATIASDIYALGVVLHQMVTGVRPTSDPKPALPSPWNSVIPRCLHTDPNARPATAARVIEELSGAHPRFSRRSFAAAAVGAVATLAIAAWAWTFQPHTVPPPALLLPIQTQEDDPALRAFVAGLTEAITLRLPALRLASTAEPGATAVRGNLQIDAGKARLTLTLDKPGWLSRTETLNVESGYTLANLLDPTIARLASALAIPVDPAAATKNPLPRSPAACDRYLQARGHLQQPGKLSSVESAISLAHQTLELEPEFAPARATLSEALRQKSKLTGDPRYRDAAEAK